MYNNINLSDPVVKCPYDNHLIARSRLQKHIVKCEKRFPEQYKVMCPYNGTHRLFEHELQEHIITCPSRRALLSEFMCPEPKQHGKIDFDLRSNISIDPVENWDEEINDNAVHTGSSRNSEDEPKFPRSADDAFEPIRPLRSYSEAALKEEDEESCVDDRQSIVSSMGVGRGAILKKNNQKYKLFKLGRGTMVFHDF